jgi:hypothetical protein
MLREMSVEFMRSGNVSRQERPSRAAEDLFFAVIYQATRINRDCALKLFRAGLPVKSAMWTFRAVIGEGETEHGR